MKSAPYHPASNGLAERAVQTFKESIQRLPTMDSFETRLSKFLLWYRLTPHSTTGVPLSELLLGRVLRSLLDLLKPNVCDKVKQKQLSQKEYHDHGAKDRQFHVGDSVFVRDFPHQKHWLPGVVAEVKGSLFYHVSLLDGRVVQRHVEHIRIRTCSSTDTNNSSNTDTEIPPVEASPHTECVPPTQEVTPAQPRQRQSNRTRAPPDYYQPTL